MNALEKQIRVKLIEYYTGEKSLAELRSWLAPILWDLGDTAPTGLRQLAYEVALLLDEYSYGHWTEDGLRREFAKLLQLQSDFRLIDWVDYSLVYRTTTSAFSPSSESTYVFVTSQQPLIHQTLRLSTRAEPWYSESQGASELAGVS